MMLVQELSERHYENCRLLCVEMQQHIKHTGRLHED